MMARQVAGWVRGFWRRAGQVARREERAYRPGEDRSLAPYVGTMLAYGGSVGLLAGAGIAAGARLPRTVEPWDVALLGVATHKVSRLVAKDTVTAPLRAPFTELQGPQGEAELAERVRGSGARHAVGELLTCPFCLAQWVATGFAAGLVFAPRATRLVAATFAVVATSDMLQNAYAILQQKATGEGAYRPRPVQVQLAGPGGDGDRPGRDDPTGADGPRAAGEPVGGEPVGGQERSGGDRAR